MIFFKQMKEKSTLSIYIFFILNYVLKMYFKIKYDSSEGIVTV